MPAGASKSKTERLEARVPRHVKSILAKAASIQGRSLTDFVVGSATEAAKRIIREREVLELSEVDQLAFAEALANPPTAGSALRAAAKRYRAKRG